MAYRTFSQPTPMRAAKFEGMPNLINAVQRNQLLKSKKESDARKAEQERIKRIEAIQYAPVEGLLPHDIEDVNKEGSALFKENIRARLAGENLSEINDKMMSFKNRAVVLKSQNQQVQDWKKEVTEGVKNDNYYIGDVDLAKVLDVASMDAGEKRDLAFRELKLRGRDAFNDVQYDADYVRALSEKYSETVKSDSGETTTEINEPFIDENGKRVITDEDVKKYIKSRPDVKVVIDEEVDGYLDIDIERMKTSNLPEQEWMKGLSDDEIKAKLIDDPKYNFYDKRDMAVRGLEIGRKRLLDAIIMDKKVNYDTATTGGEDELSDKQKDAISRTESRNDTIDKIIYDYDETALQAAYSGLKGVLGVRFLYHSEVTGGPPPENEKPIGIVVSVDDPAEEDPNKIKELDPIYINTPEAQAAAAQKINALMDDNVRGTPNVIGADPFLKEHQKRHPYFDVTKGSKNKKNIKKGGEEFDPKTLNN